MGAVESYKLGLTVMVPASLVVRLIGLLLVFASQKIVRPVSNMSEMKCRACCAVEKGNQRQPALPYWQCLLLAVPTRLAK